MTLSRSTNCQVCNNPVQGSHGGSLTQWILSCSCETQGAQTKSVETCSKCGLSVLDGKPGSFTQLLFSNDICKCAFGSALDDVVEEELQLSDEAFPCDKYKPLTELGTGGQGSVYLALDKYLNKIVAVKVLHQLESRHVIAFQQEARSTSKLQHDGIASVLNFGITSGSVPYMVLEYIQGPSLRDLLADGQRLDWRFCKVVFEQICDALKYAHARGIYHKDIKPDNVLLVENEDDDLIQARIIDFGLADITEVKQDPTSGALGPLMGSPLYMSPDSGVGRTYDARSEVYSTACVLFEALTGEPPFCGATALQTLAMHAQDAPPKLSDLVDGLPEQFEVLMERALAKDPADRYQTIEELQQALIDIEPPDEVMQETLAESKLVKRKAFSARMIIACLCLFACVCELSAGALVEFVKMETEAAKKTVLGEGWHEALEDHMKMTHGPLYKWQVGEDGNTTGDLISDDDFALLNKQPIPIRELNLLGNSPATGCGFRHLSAQPLFEANIQNQTFNDDGASNLSLCESLTTVRISDEHLFSTKAIREIAKLPKLAHLQLRYSKLPPNTVQALAASQSLCILDLGHSLPILKQDLEALGGIKNLRHIGLSGTAVDDEAIKPLLKTGLQSVEINGTRITDKGLVETLGHMKNLLGLKFNYSETLTANGIREFKRLRAKCDVIEVAN